MVKKRDTRKKKNSGVSGRVMVRNELAHLRQQLLTLEKLVAPVHYVGRLLLTRSTEVWATADMYNTTDTKCIIADRLLLIHDFYQQAIRSVQSLNDALQEAKALGSLHHNPHVFAQMLAGKFAPKCFDTLDYINAAVERMPAVLEFCEDGLLNIGATDVVKFMRSTSSADVSSIRDALQEANIPNIEKTMNMRVEADGVSDQNGRIDDGKTEFNLELSERV